MRFSTSSKVILIAACALFLLSGHATAEWQNMTVEQETNSYCSSLIYDNAEQPYILCINNSQQLSYAYKSSNRWIFEIIDVGVVSSSVSSLGFDIDGDPYVSYRNSSTMDYYYAIRSAGIWHLTDVGHNNANIFQLSLDHNKQPHICYSFPGYNVGTGISYTKIEYALYSGTSWNNITIDTIGSAGGPRGLSMYLDEMDNPHILEGSAFDTGIGSGADLKYFYKSAGTWMTDSIWSTRGSGGGNGNPYPTGISLIADKNGTPCAVYLIQFGAWSQNPVLNYTYKEGAQWHTDRIDYTGEIPGNYRYLGNPEIFINSENTPIIGYTYWTSNNYGDPINSTGINLIFKRNGIWNNEVFEKRQDKTQFSELSLSGSQSGILGICYNELPNNLRGSVMYSWNSEIQGPNNPTITGISPSSGLNSGTVTITNLSGSGFANGATVSLEKTGETSIPATNIVVVSSNKITCTFDLTGAEPGLWEVDVQNPGSLTTGSSIFTVNAAASAPVASFTAIQTSGTLGFSFTDTSTNSPTSWAWDFQNDGTTDSTLQNPSFTYNSAGTYTVKLTVTNDEGNSTTTHDVIVGVQKIPVVLVHGWNGDPSAWTALERKLDDAGIPYWTFNYSAYNTDDPRPTATNLSKFIQLKRDETGYTGKIDIVCHSMGALVSRWYIEKLGGQEHVRQWIGIGPVNHGSNFADGLDLPNAKAFLEVCTDYLNAYNEWAELKGYPQSERTAQQLTAGVTQLRTNSETVTNLSNDVSSHNIKYHVLVGKNLKENPDFFLLWSTKKGGISLVQIIIYAFSDEHSPSHGTTAVKWTDERGNVISGWTNIDEGWTFWGDGIVANRQSFLKGATTDYFEGVDHIALPSDQNVIDTTIKYLQNPDQSGITSPPVPEAHFTVDSTSGNVPLTVNFQDNSLGTPTEWIWDFHDGTPESTVQNPSHTFTKSGVYPVALTVRNSAGSNTIYVDNNIEVKFDHISQASSLNGLISSQDGKDNTVSIDKTDSSVTGNTITVTPSTSSGFKTLTIETSNPPTEDGSKITGNIDKAIAETTPITGYLGGTKGTVESNVIIETDELSPTAQLTTTVSETPTTDQTQKFSLAATIFGQKITQVAYTLSVQKSGFSEGSIQEATIIMKISKSWVNLNGGPEAIKIFRIKDDGTTEVLPTTCTLANNIYTCTGISPGFSTFGLVALSPIDSDISSGESSDSGDSSSPSSVSQAQRSSLEQPSSTNEVNVGGNSAVSHVDATGTGISDLIVTGTVHSSPGTGVSPAPGTIYEYISLMPARYTTITGATITFTVPASWLKEHHVSPEDIVMYHYTGSDWVVLPTTLVTSSQGQVTFTATSTGFSMYAISAVAGSGTNQTVSASGAVSGNQGAADSTFTGVSSHATQAAPVQQTSTVPASQAAPDFPLATIALLGGVGCVVLLGIIWGVRRWWIHRQNPALFKEYK